jgi:glycyl-tRNA synthetase beta chain
VPDLLVEIGCEELPASACREARGQLPALLDEALAAAGLAAGRTETHVAPRRLAALAFALPDERPAERREVRGPRADAPEAARAGFARKHGVAPDALAERDGVLWAVVEGSPVPLAHLVPSIVDRLATGLQFSRGMRWDAGRFSRPVRWLVAVAGGEVAPCELFGVRAGSESGGHRVVAPRVPLSGAGAYRDELRAAHVVAAVDERLATIRAGLEALGRWDDPMGKLDEVVDLVEWPVVLAGTFDRRYLELPERVPVTAMQSHQRYFPLRDEDGRLAPRFGFVANHSGRDGVVVAGNEEVLVGRLEDAAFSHAKDRERGLAAMVAELGRVSFLEGGGSLADKGARVRSLVEALCELNGVGPADRSAALRAAELAKADLVSGLVSEFADLQGYAGSLYARDAGEAEAVCAAIEEHHRPLEAGGETPASLAGALVAAADKADTLAVAFALGARPTGSRDPYGLRRAAAGLVAIALERGLELEPQDLFTGAAEALAAAGGTMRRDADEAADAAVSFTLDRVDAALTEEGVVVEELRAARGSGADEPLDVAARARVLRDRRGDPRLAELRDTYGRCVRIAARAGDLPPASRQTRSEPAERALIEALAGATERVSEQLRGRRADAALDEAHALVAPVSRLFDEVLVMDPDPDVRSKRIALVNWVAVTIRRIADLDELPG